MELTPVQRRTLDELMRRDPLPVFDRGLAEDLRTDLECRLAPVAGAVGDGQTLWVTKARLTKLHAQCEGLFLADHHGEGEFEYSERLAVGAVVHRAVELAVYARELSDVELVDRAVEQVARDDERFDAYLVEMGAAERASLVGAAVEQVLLFRATFPPFEAAWSPAVEPRLKVHLLGGRVVLSARPDLMLGGVDGEEPMRARRIILELKTGLDRPDHDEDLRFYALAATLRLGVPPYRVATVLLEDGRWRSQDVTPDLLESAVRRVGNGYARVAGLLAGEEPTLRPGAWCAWCPRSATCPQSSVRGRRLVGTPG
jgi:hypothetical protein